MRKRLLRSVYPQILAQSTGSWKNRDILDAHMRILLSGICSSYLRQIRMDQIRTYDVRPDKFGWIEFEQPKAGPKGIAHGWLE
jgi:hypothetical protein